MWYGQKVERDLSRWQAAGWISDTGASAIRADLASRKPPFGAAAILAMLGAVLFGFAIMSFVAANWDAMSKLSRLLLLLADAVGLLRRRAWLFQTAAADVRAGRRARRHRRVRRQHHADLADVPHGGQPARRRAAVGAGRRCWRRAGAVHRALAATFVLLVVWTWWERSLSNAAHLASSCRGRAAALARGCAGVRGCILPRQPHLLADPLGFFIARPARALAGGAARRLRGSGRGAGAGHRSARRISAATFAYAIVIALPRLFIMQFVDSRWFFGTAPAARSGASILLAAISIVGLLGAMLWALKTDNTAALWLAYAGFALEVFMLHVMTIGTLLNTSLFFLVSALIVSAFAYAAYRLHQRKAVTPGVAP
jgi:hypothetical protein